MINDNIRPRPIDPTGFRFPTETEMAIDETLKLCGISGEDASCLMDIDTAGDFDVEIVAE